MSIEWITHKNKRILYVKYKGLSPKEMGEQARAATKLIVDSKSQDNLVLTDMLECFVNEEFIEIAKEQGKISLPFCKKSAIVGVTGIKKLILKSVNAFTAKSRVPFDTVEEAKAWLVE